jgi:predicted RNA-binding Zn-ribbon protein involved in translation (DUF1610 family)
MPTITCEACEQNFTAVAKPGTKVTCPHCGDVNVVRPMPDTNRATTGAAPPSSGSDPAPTPVTVASTTGRTPHLEHRPPTTDDGLRDGPPPRSGHDPDARPRALGLPPASGEEVLVITVHREMFRARPLSFLGLWAAVVGGLIAAVIFLNSSATGARLGAWMCLLIALAALITLGVWKIRTFAQRLRITNKRSVLTRGLLSRSSVEILHRTLQEIEVRQSFAQRLMGIGSLMLSNAAESEVEIIVHDVRNPDHLRQIIDAYRPL